MTAYRYDMDMTTIDFHTLLKNPIEKKNLFAVYVQIKTRESVYTPRYTIIMMVFFFSGTYRTVLLLMDTRVRKIIRRLRCTRSTAVTYTSPTYRRTVCSGSEKEPLYDRSNGNNKKK